MRKASQVVGTDLQRSALSLGVEAASQEDDRHRPGGLA